MRKPRIFTFVASVLFMIFAVMSVLMLADINVRLGDMEIAPPEGSDPSYAAGIVGLIYVMTVGSLFVLAVGMYFLSAILSLVFGIFAARSSIKGIRIATYVSLGILASSLVAEIILLAI